MIKLPSPCSPCRRRSCRRSGTRTNAPARCKAGDRRGSTGCPGCPARNSRRRVRLVLPLRLHKHRYRLACREAEGPVPKHGQDGRDLAGVARHRHPGRVVLAEDLVQHDLGAGGLAGRVLARNAVPEWVLFREARLELPRGEEAGDVRAVGATVACVDADALPKELFYSRCERPTSREIESAEGDVGGIEAPPHW